VVAKKEELRPEVRLL
jgi:hypothetical protein